MYASVIDVTSKRAHSPFQRLESSAGMLASTLIIKPR